MAHRRHIVGAVTLVLLAGAVAEAGEPTGSVAPPLIGLCFIAWLFISAMLSANHPSISTVALVYWFLLFFPVSLLLFDGNIEVYLAIWYAYIAISFCVVLVLKHRFRPKARRFLLKWKGITLVAVTLLTILAETNAVDCVSRFGGYLHGFTTPDFVYLFGVVSCAVVALTFLAYYVAMRRSSG
ncbi:MAG: hypothetical protein GXP25_24055 [Planctomycetes bacterium]|nr:hypothetical protein [Planctomycetota bacterium]